MKRWLELSFSYFYSFFAEKRQKIHPLNLFTILRFFITLTTGILRIAAMIWITCRPSTSTGSGTRTCSIPLTTRCHCYKHFFVNACFTSDHHTLRSLKYQACHKCNAWYSSRPLLWAAYEVIQDLVNVFVYCGNRTRVVPIGSHLLYP